MNLADAPDVMRVRDVAEILDCDPKTVYKLIDEDIGIENQGITIVVAYRTASAFKYGLFGIVPDRDGQ